MMHGPAENPTVIGLDLTWQTLKSTIQISLDPTRSKLEVPSTPAAMVCIMMNQQGSSNQEETWTISVKTCELLSLTMAWIQSVTAKTLSLSVQVSKWLMYWGAIIG